VESHQRPAAKQPYAIAIKDGSPFAIVGCGNTGRTRQSGEWIRTFAVITTDANELLAESMMGCPDAALPGCPEADVANLDPRQQAGES
jgi:hypothetical protein